MNAMLARVAAIIGLLFHHGASHNARAQFLPSLQANDQAEFDSYLAVLHATGPTARLTAADAFERAWPKSELLPHVYELRFDAQRQFGDAKAAIVEGHRALAAAPGNLTVAARLAAILANEGRVDEAEGLVQQVDRVLATFRVPRSVPLPVWQERVRWIRARAAVALGLAAFKRDRTTDAIARFEEAVKLSPEPIDHLRLGRLYRLVGRRQEAQQQFKLAMQTGDATVKTLAGAEAQSRP